MAPNPSISPARAMRSMGPFHSDGLAQRVAPFVAAGSLAALLLFGTDVALLPAWSVWLLGLSLALLASLYLPVWHRLPRVLQAVPIGGVLIAVVLPTVGLQAVGGDITLAGLSFSLVAALLAPWQRLPRWLQAVPPLAALVVVAVVHVMASTPLEVTFPFVLVVVLWLALYHDVRELVAGLQLAVVCFVIPVPGVQLAESLGHAALYALVTCLIAFSITSLLHELSASEALMSRMALTDPLTGVANRRELDERLQAMGTRRFAVIAIDVDDLKVVNDTHGHQAGDAALQSVASVIQDCLRQGDLVARVGGDEFTALLPGATLDEARGVANRMLAALREFLPASGAVRVSAGCAANQAGQSVRAVLAAADRAMYAAKGGGRDRVAVASAETPSDLELGGRPKRRRVKVA